jgi:hypothetical protein
MNYYFIKLLLQKITLILGINPKALPFHNYQNRLVTPVEEHLQECIYYASSNNSSNLHFTMSEAHLGQFETN